MKVDILTLFPELVETTLRTSITGRAEEAGIWSLTTWDIRAFAGNRYGRVDDTLYGGGRGMLMQCEPIWQSWQAAVKAAQAQGIQSSRILVAGPKGRVFDQTMAKEFAQEEHLVFLCGHYEGIDQRVLDELGAEEVSLGDFVLTGGELAVCAMIDATLRMVTGVLPGDDAFQDESHYDGLLEARQYTKPAEWKGREVPEVLLSGHHAKIAAARRRDQLRETLLKRPDLIDQASDLSDEDRQMLAEIALDLYGQA